jgi:hypothetical protein
MAQDDFVINDHAQPGVDLATVKKDLEAVTHLLADTRWQWFKERIAKPMLEEKHQEVMEADIAPGDIASKVIAARAAYTAIRQLLERPKELRDILEMQLSSTRTKP